MKKTVYILGAGFSVEAGAPSQEKLIEKIFLIHKEKPYEYDNGTVEKFKSFLTNSLNIPESLHSKIPLEDVFTPIDRALLDNLTFRNLTNNEVKEIREVIYYLIGKTIQIILKESDKEYIDKFAKFLVDKCSLRANKNYRSFDEISVLSTNWDILLDNSVKSILDSDSNKGVVDYCCYISSYKINDDTIKPGLEKLGEGGFNVKILKLHGSLNWLQCPRCQRLYVDFYQKISVDNYSTCRHCNNNFGRQKSHRLSSNLIMPTFLKDLSNPQYKIIWQNAGIELSEAEKIVFIGYSLPFADFEMRQLLSRMVRDDAKIEVVDYGKDNAPNIIDMKSRYNNFFGSREIEFYLGGAKKYVEEKLIKD